MICSNCQKENREGSRFCEHCGTPLSAPAEEPVVVPVAESVPVEVEEAPVAAPLEVEVPAEEPVKEEAPVVEETPAPQPEPVVIPVVTSAEKPQKEKKPKKEKKAKGKKPVGLIITSILLALLFLASAGLNVYQYFNHKQLQTTIDEKDAKLAQMNQQAADLIAEKEDITQQLADANVTISSLWDTIDEMSASMNEEAAILDAYDRLINCLTYSELGYYSDEFYAEYFLLPMVVGEECSFMLTTAWEGSGTVDMATDNDGATVDFAENSWNTEVPIKVVANATGVTIVTFYWQEQEASFDVIILVTEE